MGWGGGSDGGSDDADPGGGYVAVSGGGGHQSDDDMGSRPGHSTPRGGSRCRHRPLFRRGFGERSEDGRGFARRLASPTAPWMAGFYNNFKVGKGECVGHGFQVSYVNGARPHQRPRNVRRKLQAPHPRRLHEARVHVHVCGESSRQDLVLTENSPLFLPPPPAPGNVMTRARAARHHAVNFHATPLSTPRARTS